MKSTYLKPVLDLCATGERIKTLMKQRGISVKQMQIILGFPYCQTIYNWFQGKNMPTIDNLVVLARVLSVRMDEIVVTRNVEVSVEDPLALEVISA